MEREEEKGTLRPFCAGGQVASTGARKRSLALVRIRVGGTRRGPESLGRVPLYPGTTC